MSRHAQHLAFWIARLVTELRSERGAAGKFSKSRGAAVGVPYYLSKYDPDPLGFYLTATATETQDTEGAILLL